MDTSIDTLRRLVDVDKKFYSKFKDIIDERQGIETHLAKMYLPITTAVEKTGETIQEQKTNLESLLNRIHETPLLGEILEIVRMYPNIIQHIINPDYSTALTRGESVVYNKVIKLPRNKLELLREFIIADRNRIPPPQPPPPPQPTYPTYHLHLHLNLSSTDTSTFYLNLHLHNLNLYLM